MHTIQVLTLLLALSGTLNMAFTAAIIARHAGVGRPRLSSPPAAPPAPSWPSSSLPSPPTADSPALLAAQRSRAW